MSRPVSNRDGGFTLLEILVSLAILAVSIPILMGVIANGVRKSNGTELAMDAGAVAQALLAKAGKEFSYVEGERVGQQEGGFRWRVQVKPYGSQRDQNSWPVYGADLSVRVIWNEGPVERSIVLRTLRLTTKEKIR